MIIAVVCDILGEENNGTAVATMNLIHYLQSEKHTVRILCADQSKAGEENYFVVPTRSFGKALDRYISRVGVSLAKPNMQIVLQRLSARTTYILCYPSVWEWRRRKRRTN